MLQRNFCFVLVVVALLVLEACCQNGGKQATGVGEGTNSHGSVRVISPGRNDDEDDEDWSGEGASGSGMGSGFLATTDSPDGISTLAPDTQAGSGDTSTVSTKSVVYSTDLSSTTDHEVINPTTRGDNSATTEIDNNVEVAVTYGGHDNSLDGSKNSLHSSKGNHEDNNGAGGLSFTVGIIAGVVIGALLAILVILFLVYRLRKKDAGSYLLEDHASGYKPMPGSPGGDKEYYT